MALKTKIKLMALLVGGLTMAAGTGPADAVPYTFTVSGSYNATFQLDSSPVPHRYVSGGQFELTGQKNPLDYGFVDMFFYNGNETGGFYFYEPGSRMDLLILFGPQLYTGPEMAPTFRTGTFTLFDYATNAPATLSITSTTAAVPEPATWAMMILGFGAIGYAMRRKTVLRFV